MTVKTGDVVLVRETGLKPESTPVTFGMIWWMGTQGFSKVDCVTV